MVSRRQFLTMASSGTVLALATRNLHALGGTMRPQNGAAEKILVYLTPTCSCCAKWLDHLKTSDFEIDTREAADVDPIKRAYNIPEKLWSCHTAVAGPYAIEGHVPASAIQRLLHERPAVAGIAVAGMPMGSPGMEHGDHKEPFDVMSFTCCGDVKVFAKG